MRITVSDAKAQLTDLVRRAEEGEEVILTRHGLPVACLHPIQPVVGATARARAVALARSAAGTQRPGPDAARSQDFLYGDDGLPK